MRTVLYVRAFIIKGREALVDERKDGYRMFGGRVKSKETILQAIVRELDEELGGQWPLEIGQVVNIDETVRKKTRRISFVFLVHAGEKNEHFKIMKRGKHRPCWIDAEHSGVHLGVKLEQSQNTN